MRLKPKFAVSCSQNAFKQAAHILFVNQKKGNKGRGVQHKYSVFIKINKETTNKNKSPGRMGSALFSSVKAVVPFDTHYVEPEKDHSFHTYMPEVDCKIFPPGWFLCAYLGFPSLFYWLNILTTFILKRPRKFYSE